ncbi:peptidase [Geomonas limicola]|uniref:Peptidase n=1 Tax=Geomonas limicola TaxID=2740186 RepID=A0A6V8N698_9BACT|nr:alpha/beta hydrolase [Geomonas limicola]GFO68105.1 peptidase [Geomonas limicola]
MYRWCVRIVSIVTLLCCQGCLGRFFYYPGRNVYHTPEKVGLPYEEVTFPSSDGTKLSGWFIPAVGVPQGTVIHFHGNAQNMTAHFSYVYWLPRAGFNLFVFDYRGYGKSAGAPDRAGLFEDAQAALRYVAGRNDVDRERLVVLGQSLGGTNAIAALGGTGTPRVQAVAVESAFASYRSIVREKMAQIPVLSLLRWPLSYLLIGDSYSALDAVAAISPVPLLLIYETQDNIVPISEGLKLYEKAREPKELWQVPGGTHAGAFAEADSPYRKALVQFYQKALPGKAGPAPVGPVSPAPR